jgi:hypothetical protein
LGIIWVWGGSNCTGSGSGSNVGWLVRQIKQQAWQYVLATARSCAGHVRTVQLTTPAAASFDWLSGRAQIKLVPPLLLLLLLLIAEECDYLRNTATPRLKPSGVSDSITGVSYICAANMGVA